MKKIRVFSPIFVFVFLPIIISIIIYFYPTNIVKISGTNKEMLKEQDINLKIIHRKTFNSKGFSKISQDINKINILLEHLNKYKLRRRFIREHNINDENYSITIEINNRKILALMIEDNKHMRIKTRIGSYTTYKLINNEVDSKFFKDFYDSLDSNLVK